MLTPRSCRTVRRPHGAAEIEKALAGFLAEVTITEFQLTTTDLTVKDNMAIETGTTRSVMQPKQGGGPPVTDVGKYVVVWKKQTDGSWKLWRDIFNSDASPAPAK
jgi:ketosteroid isomerase-like protein